MARLKLTLTLGFLSVVAVLFVTVWSLRSQNEQEGNLERKEVKEMAKEKAVDDKKYMTFNDWLTGTFSYSTFYPNWISDSEYVYRNSSGALMKKNISSEEEDVLLKAEAWNGLTNPSSYSVSADSQYVAIVYENTDGYAHYVKTFSVAVFATSDSSQVTIPNFPGEKIQKIKWSPVDHKMAFVYEFDVYVIVDFTAEPARITSDGEENKMFNGISDWLYSIEITNDDALLWWSPQGRYLAYATVDQTGVKDFDFALFGGNQYPNMISFPYPKPGTPIPKTKTFIIDTMPATPTSVEASPSTTVTDWGEYYLNSALWRSEDIFSPTWKNRFENEAVTESCQSGSSFTCSHVLEMESKSTTGWLGHYKPADLVRMPNSSEYMTVLSNPTKFPHLVIINADDNTRDFRTTGTFEVTDTGSGDASIFYYDEANDLVYFTSTEVLGSPGEGLPRIRHLWRVKAHGNDKTRECISCDLNTLFKDRCNWVRPSFSPEGGYLVVNCGGTGNGAPISTLHSISPSGNITFIRVVQSNSQLVENMEAYHFRTKEFGEISLPGVDGTFYYTLHKPPNFDETKKYPMLVQVYSGPGYQYTTDSFTTDWARGYIASSDLDVVVMTFDGRGTGFRGDEIMHMVYKNLGKYEPIDQIEATRQVSNMFDFIDKERIAIWGRSYGGYSTSRVIAEDEDLVFKCGFSVAPVTDWLTYHSIYTERYMTSPEENGVGYNESIAIQKLENFGKHYFVLVHGTSDENVHFLNSARLSKALIEADVDFSAYFAGDETHSFNRGSNAYGHHYKLLTHHLKICFGIAE